MVTLGCDTKIDATEREQAARILGDKGHKDQAIMVWISLIRDLPALSPMKKSATAALGRIADADVLPILEQIAQQNRNLDVRRAAQRAIKQFRERTEHNHADTPTTLPRQD
jgi:HEAT repeat protein